MRLLSQTGRRIAVGIASVAATACASSGVSDPGPGKRVVATVDRGDYLAGQKVGVIVTNLSDLSLEYPLNFCAVVLEREDATGWTPVVVPEGCLLAIAYLGPYRTATLQYALPTGVTSGTYRLTMAMPVPKGSTTPEPRLVTPTFRIATGAL